MTQGKPGELNPGPKQRMCRGSRSGELWLARNLDWRCQTKIPGPSDEIPIVERGHLFTVPIACVMQYISEVKAMSVALQ